MARLIPFSRAPRAHAPRARAGLAVPLAGALAAGLSALVLALLARADGLPAWVPLNATSHVLHGPAALSRDLDWGRTGLGAGIHVVSAVFWAAVAFLLVRLMGRGGTGPAIGAGLFTAGVAGLVDYGLLPSRLSPGWELVLSPAGVIGGFAALGAGLAAGLALAEAAEAGTSAGRDR